MLYKVKTSRVFERLRKKHQVTVEEHFGPHTQTPLSLASIPESSSPTSPTFFNCVPPNGGDASAGVGVGGAGVGGGAHNRLSTLSLSASTSPPTSGLGSVCATIGSTSSMYMNSAYAQGAQGTTLISNVSVVDEDPYAIYHIHFCPESRKLAVAGAYHTLSMTFARKEAFPDVTVCTLHVTFAFSISISIH